MHTDPLRLNVSKNICLEILLSFPLTMQSHAKSLSQARRNNLQGAASFLLLVAKVSRQRCSRCCEQLLSRKWITITTSLTRPGCSFLNPILFRNPMYLYISLYIIYIYTSLRFVVGHEDDHVQSVDHPLAPCLHGARLRFKG